MKTRNLTWLALFSMGAVACGPTSDPNGDDSPNVINTVDPQKIDPIVGCNAGYCGEARFRAAIPTRKTLSIRYGTQSSALAELSEAYGLVGDHVLEINETVEDVFGAIEEIAATEPEVAEDNLHVWRQEIEGIEVVLQISTNDDETFDFALDAGDPGLELDTASLGIAGSVVLDENDNKESFEFIIELDELGYVPEDDFSGEFIVSAMPYADGLWEVNYDISIEDAESSFAESTTYWVLGENDGALEYAYGESDADRDEVGQVFVRWDDAGGRYDAFVQGNDIDNGDYDLIQTECWDGVGGLLFVGEAMFSDVDSYAEFDGDELACEWELEDAHPDADLELIGYFDDESWSDYDDLGGPTNNDPINNTPVNNEPVGDCDADAEIMNDALFDCGYETEDVAALCSDPVAVADCVDALEFSDDPCATLDEPVCY